MWGKNVCIEKNSIFRGRCNTMEKLVTGKSNKAFLHFFFAKFLLYLIILQSSAAPSVHSTFKNHQICQKFSKKWRKALFDLPLTHISIIARVSGTRSANKSYNIFSSSDQRAWRALRLPDDASCNFFSTVILFLILKVFIFFHRLCM